MRTERKEFSLLCYADFVISSSVMKANGWFRIPRPALSIPLMMKKVALFSFTCKFNSVEILKDLTVEFERCCQVVTVNWIFGASRLVCGHEGLGVVNLV